MPSTIIPHNGGFLLEPENPALDRYILAQARVPTPRVLLLPTASGDGDSYVVRFYSAFQRLDCVPRHLLLFRNTEDVRAAILGADVIYVSGGNTKSMLAVWHEWGIPELLREACAAGTVLSGVSAGAICWFERGMTDSWADRIVSIPCLGLLPDTLCPYYDTDTRRRAAFEAEGRAGWGLDVGAAAHFVDGALHRVVASRPGPGLRRFNAEGAVRFDGDVLP